MFYSHQLLARKAPLGQIWMAATLHAKINRRKLDKLNIIKICEEILNPTVPMALRLSGILMGGVVIVYERKVKVLYEDVNRLLVEINEAWKTKSAAPSDPTRLPKNKCQAKRESVTLPKNHVEDLGEIEQSVPYSNGNTTFMGFQQTSYFAMRLDSVDDTLLNQTTQGALNNDNHQVDAANITLLDDYDPCQADTNAFNHFERFDIEGDEEFTPPEHTDIPSTLIPSPPPPEQPQKPDEIQEQHPEEQVKKQSEESKGANQVPKMQRPVRRAKRKAALDMHDEYNVIPGQIYQTWLRDPSDIVSNRGRRRNMPQDPVSRLKIDIRLGLPSVVVFEKLFTSNMQIHYPEPLLNDWMKISQPPLDSPSGRTSAPQPPEPSASSTPDVMRFMGPMPDPFEDFNSKLGPLPVKNSIERQRADVYNNERPEVFMEELTNNLKPNGVSDSNPMGTPEYSGDGIRSVPSSGSGKSFPKIPDVNLGKKRPFSGSKNSGNGLEPVAEELSWEQNNPKYKMARLSEHGLAPNDDLLVETGPTQTQKHPTTNHQPLDPITDAIKTHLKTHFDTHESAKEESLINLARGMNKKRAACLFYQTCVLATRNFIKVEQRAPYGDILISRGANM